MKDWSFFGKDGISSWNYTETTLIIPFNANCFIVSLLSLCMASPTGVWEVVQSSYNMGKSWYGSSCFFAGEVTVDLNIHVRANPSKSQTMGEYGNTDLPKCFLRFEWAFRCIVYILYVYCIHTKISILSIPSQYTGYLVDTQGFQYWIIMSCLNQLPMELI